MLNWAMTDTERDYQNKFIVFYEFDGETEEVNYLIRTLQSEVRLGDEYTVRSTAIS